MVGHTIDNWYADAEGGGSDSAGYDWENDDRPDRTPDSWLDRLATTSDFLPPAEREPSSERQANARGRRGGNGDSSPTWFQLANAAQVLRLKSPHINEEAIAKQLRDGGWSKVTADVVKDALATPLPNGPVLAKSARKSSARRSEQQQRQATPRNEPKAQPEARRKKRKPSRKARAAARNRRVGAQATRTLARAVQELQAEIPGLNLHELTRRLREDGWQTVSERDVQAALAPTQPDVSRREPLELPRHLSVPVLRAGACPACGVVVSSLGQCRCS